jgi:hypothetical protein
MATKDAQLYVRLTDEEEAMLDALTALHVRSKSDEVRFLIRREYEAEFGVIVTTTGEGNSAT